MYFQEDGVPPHCYFDVRTYLHGNFQSRWVGRSGTTEYHPIRHQISPSWTFLYKDTLTFSAQNHEKSINWKLLLKNNGPKYQLKWYTMFFILLLHVISGVWTVTAINSIIRDNDMNVRFHSIIWSAKLRVMFTKNTVNFIQNVYIVWGILCTMELRLFSIFLYALQRRQKWRLRDKIAKYNRSFN